MSHRCVVLVPVKPPGSGKSRLRGVSDVTRGRLAAAFATDAISACLATAGVARVLVVTDDTGIAATATALGGTTCGDGHGAGLNAALRHGAAVARAESPELRPVALLADLPALRPSDLADALARLADGAAYVADADGTGTTLYSAAYDAFDPRFGPGSAAAHAAAGALPLAGNLPGLRRDVDDIAALRAAVELGVGAATAAALAGAAGLGGPADLAGLAELLRTTG